MISIHTLRVEGDVATLAGHVWDATFQSTPSAWRVTIGDEFKSSGITISIHTLRVEGDYWGESQ